MWGHRAKIDPADTAFSIYIRLRDKKCLYCHRPGEPDKLGRPIIGLQNSHYWSRAKEGTRFEPDNCISLCAYHHNYLGHGEGREEYVEIMKKRLGEQRYETLQVQANTYCRKDRKLQYMIFKKMLEELK